jgi:transcriptional regulator with XRE-family HTH domain
MDVEPVGRLIARRRKELKLSQKELAEKLNEVANDTTMTRNEVSRYERGGRLPRDWLPYLAQALDLPLELLDAAVKVTRGEPIADLDARALSPATYQVESLRQGLESALNEGIMAEASLDDWEHTVLRYGNATRHRPPALMLDDLSSDISELQRALNRHRSASALRRLTRVTAQMSGLMLLTLVKLDDRSSFRRWTRTARLAAQEAGDPEALAWVLAQEAYGHYYSGDLTEALDVAQHSQHAVRIPCTGAVLAAALEARAQAALGRGPEARAAIARTEEIMARLDPGSVIPSAFGYSESQFRFHAGNAYTHLGDTKAAWKEQKRALEIIPAGDYTDRVLTQLDHASCLVRDRDASGAMIYASEVLVDLDSHQREGIINLRGHEVLNSLPAGEHANPAAKDFRDLLMLTTDTKGCKH